MRKLIVVLGMTAIAAAGCSSESAPEGSKTDRIGQVGQSIRNGTFAAFPQLESVVMITDTDSLCGSGTLIAPQWVLTAGHVIDEPQAPSAIEVRLGNQLDPTAPVRHGAAVFWHPAQTVSAGSGPVNPSEVDIALVRLDSPFTGALTRSISSAATDTFLGTSVTCMGYGDLVEGLNSFGTLAFASLPVTGFSTNWVWVDANTFPLGSQLPLPGDSGGPCLTSSGQVMGVISTSDGEVPSMAAFLAPASSFRTWANGIMNNCANSQPGSADFCSATCPCPYGGGDCDANNGCVNGMACATDKGAGFAMPPTTDVCVDSACVDRTLGSGTYCSTACPCGHGGGDCDTDAQCMGGFVCADDIGPGFAMTPTTDVCVPTACAGRTFGGGTFCSAACPCGHGGGDCDSDAQCMPGFVCDDDVGPAFKMTPTTDVCVPSACSSKVLGAGDFCSAACRCGHGGGDCDTDADCMPGMVCDADIGPAFDMSVTTDVCVPSACSTRTLYAADFCSTDCPCGHGGGDCDSDAECMPGLVCGTDNGAAFGQPSSWDICVRP